MASKYAMEKAAQAWCKPSTKNKVMDSELALAFAEILDGELHPQAESVFTGTVYTDSNKIITVKNGLIVDVDTNYR